MVRFTRLKLTYVYNSKVLEWYDTGYPKVAYVSDLADLGKYYCDMYRGHGNIQGMRGVRKQLQQEEQNIRQPSRMALNSSTAVQQS